MNYAFSSTESLDFRRDQPHRSPESLISLGGYGSILSRDEKADNLHEDSSNPHEQPTKRERWISLSIALFTSFLQTLQFSIFWTSLWPFLTTIDPSTSEVFYGAITMAFNLASALTSPLYGWWTNRIQQCRLPIFTGNVIAIFGNLLLANVEAFDSNRKWVVLAARAISGIGCGNYGSQYAYIVMASSLEERSRVISTRASLSSLGIMLGPALNTVFVLIGYPGFVRGRFHLDLYTAIAWANVLSGIAQNVVLLLFFKEYWIAVDDTQMNQPKSTSQMQNAPTSGLQNTKLQPFSKLAAASSWWIRFSYQFMMAFDITIGSPFTMLMFGWSAKEAVLYNGIVQIVTSVIDLLGNLFMGFVVLKYVQERKTILVGLTLAFLFFVTNFSWPSLPPIIASSQNTTATASGAATALSVGNNATSTNRTLQSNCGYSWCSYTTRVYLWQYLLAQFFAIAAVSVGYTPNATIYSKILGPRKQGLSQGLFAAAGQIAMTVSPLVCSAIWQAYGPRITYGVVGAIIVTAMLAAVVGYREMIPWDEYVTRSESKKQDENRPILSNENLKHKKYLNINEK